jgi:hypothetical protein
MVVKLMKYNDIEQVLATVINSPNQRAEYKLPDYAAAVRWRQRANNFRVALRRIDANNREVPEAEGSCIYDQLVFSLTKGSSIVKIFPLTDGLGTLTIGGIEQEINQDDELEQFLSGFETVRDGKGDGD